MSQEKGQHLFAEATSRYDLRCVRCGVRALGHDPRVPCKGPVLEPNDPPAWRIGEPDHE